MLTTPFVVKYSSNCFHFEFLGTSKNYGSISHILNTFLVIQLRYITPK
jgi:hypothetical protein